MFKAMFDLTTASIKLFFFESLILLSLKKLEVLLMQPKLQWSLKLFTAELLAKLCMLEPR
jgi:hypothetical protein